jgi:hypothetical protein
MIPIAHRRADDLRGVRIRTCAAFGLAFGLSAGLAEPLRADDDARPILSAVNLAGSAMDYDGIAFAADDGIATGEPVRMRGRQ